MIVYSNPDHGTAYAMEDGALISTPLYEDLTYDTCFDNWVEVDMDHAIAEGYNPESICKFITRCEDMSCVYDC